MFHMDVVIVDRDVTHVAYVVIVLEVFASVR
jgi:hypothetical protein